MATVIIAIIVFGIVGLDVWFLANNLVHHKGKLGCSGCASGCAEGGCAACGGNCSSCSLECEKSNPS